MALVDCTFISTPSVVFDAVFVPSLGTRGLALAGDANALRFVYECFAHGKAIGLAGSGAMLLAGIGAQAQAATDIQHPHEGVVVAGAGALAKEFSVAFIAAIGAHRHWSRSKAK